MLFLLRPCFARPEPWLQAAKYVGALASGLPKRNGWTIAEHAGDRSPDRTQRLLNRAAWDTWAAMGIVRRFAVAGLDEAARRSGRRRGLVIGALDETGQEKQGAATAGVQRQYLGRAGRVANGINTVHLAYVHERAGHALIGARQWIPRAQIEDPVKFLAMGLPPGLEFRTKGQLAIDVSADALADGIRFDFFCGDEVYGNCTELRAFFEAAAQAYVLRVPRNFRLTLPGGRRFTAFATDAKTGQLADLELRHRRRARCEDRIRCAKDTGLRNLPLHGFAQNQLWCELVAMASELTTWMQMLALDGAARTWEPKRLRLRLFSAAGRIVRGGRRLRLRLAATWPWAGQLTAAITRLQALAPG